MRKVLSSLVVVLVAVGISACGDDDDDDVASVEEPDGSSDAGGTVSITAVGFAFDPDAADAAAGEVHFAITNEDDAAHTFTIDDADVDIALDPKGSGEDDADLEAGTYEWRCKIHASMTGTLTVT